MRIIEIQQILAPYYSTPSDEACARINSYIDLLLRWNRKISLTTVSDPSKILSFHFGESIFAAPSCGMSVGSLVDVGSGAGFPGLPLAVICPHLAITLIESNRKKAAFLSEVIRELRLQNATVFSGRMDEFTTQQPGFDFVTSRAFGQFDALLRWARGILLATGKVGLWVGSDDAADVAKTLGWSWEVPVKIPGSDRRQILTGSISHCST